MAGSKFVLALSDRFPSLARFAVRLVGTLFVRLKIEPHWLLMRLKRELDVRIPSKARLPTGELVWVDALEPVGQLIARDGCSELETFELFDRLVEPGMVVFDVGAHVGQYTALASSKVRPGGQVHAFEPDPKTFRLLRSTVRANRSRNVILNQIALSAISGRQRFYAYPGSAAQNSLNPLIAGSAESHTVRVERLDTYVLQRSVPRIDILKIDVEGAELLVLQGAQDILIRSQPLVILEFSKHQAAFGCSPEDLASYLSGKGYALYRIGDDALSPLQPNTALFTDGLVFFNVLAIPHSKRGFLSERVE